jgi:endoglucanase
MARSLPYKSFWQNKAVLLVSLLSFAIPGLAQSTGYWHTSGNQIVDATGKAVRLSGVNWYGFETTDEVAHGLWAQDYKTILKTIQANGYNVIRIPFSNQMVESPVVPSNINTSNGMNSDLGGLNSLQVLDKIVAYAGQIGLRVILDNHRSEAGNSAEGNGLWYTSSYPESAWLNDWKTLASRYANNSTVVGMDLRNEPHNATGGGSCWGCGSSTNDWRLAAQRGGNAVLSVNPKLLVFVEGTDCVNGDCDWWGGNLEGVQQYPVSLNVANQLVYSAHDYGPTEYGQSWFNGSTTASSLNAVWTKYWAYISQNKIAPVWLGEFGTTNNAGDLQNSANGSQGQWFQSLVSFLKSNSSISWTYWALNGEDRYGLLDNNYDPTPASSLKQQMLASIQGGAAGGGTGGGGGGATIPAAPNGLVANAASTSEIDLSWNASSTAGVTYDVYSSVGTSVSVTPSSRIANGLTGTTFQETGLKAGTTYAYLVTAVNTAGESKPSNQATATTKSSGGGGSGGGACHVSYADQNDWKTGFTGGISITNNSQSPINGWTLTWTWSGNQQITTAWNATYSQSSNKVTLNSQSYNGSIPAGSQVNWIGFNANYSGSNNAPSAFYLNGTLCH